MEDPRIIPPRVPFVDPKTGNIRMEWFHWLLSLVTEVNVSTLTNIFNSTTAVTQELSQPSAQAQAVRLVAEVPTPIPQVGKRDVQDASFLARLPKAFPVVKRDLQNVELQAIRPNNDAAFQKMMKRISDLEILIAMQRQGSGSGGGGEISCAEVNACIDCDTIESVGYWSPVTDGAMGLIDNGDGEVVVAFTCTS